MVGAWTVRYGSTEGAAYRCAVIQLPSSSKKIEKQENDKM